MNNIINVLIQCCDDITPVKNHSFKYIEVHWHSFFCFIAHYMKETKIEKYCEFHSANRDNLKVTEKTLQKEKQLEGVEDR